MAQPDRNFNAMRQDAIRRSREMQRRAVTHSSMPAPPPEPASHPEPAPDPEPLFHEPACESPKPSGLLSSLQLPGELQDILTNWDTEKLALAGLLWLLWKEGADPSLLLALAYILL